MSTLETKLRLSVLSTDPVIKKCLSTNMEKLKFALQSADECGTWLTRKEMGLLCSLSYKAVNWAIWNLRRRGLKFMKRLRFNPADRQGVGFEDLIGLEIEYRVVE